MKKKILVNAYFSQNLGDDLFLKVLFDRYPNVDWYLLTSNTKYNGIFKKYKNVSILKSMSVNFFGIRKIDAFHKINKLLLKYKKYDALLNIGGSIFMEGIGWEEALIKRRVLPDEFNRLKKKSFIIGANFGPF
ncbi:hypothetical protein [Virgibacillus necropolis]|uniref:Polysaccharide pyruvyl transferase domain-containing protein n=1 Tax=Virgibacillus necropolis TaxID=163877 RepID=A0A221MEB2_9BACI|nr:hypothetical protein [Virgibacillus necropolis]ASN05987.1 hypothetical protein CFK40_13650 [Virgibacillus necropolis]